MLAQLDTHATEVQKIMHKDQALDLGLWFSATSAAEILRTEGGQGLPALKQWLAERRLSPFTLNGFPYGDFHGAVVKHSVYHPEWGTLARTSYTRDLIQILDGLLPKNASGTISTLPIGWAQASTTRSRTVTSEDRLERAAHELLVIASELRQLEERTGRNIAICLEPEPGCMLQTSHDVVQFFERWIFPRSTAADVVRYLKVCHDTCHASVMFEGQDAVLERYRQAAIQIGKVQISSALHAPFATLNHDARVDAWRQLFGFAEDRYLHQTSIDRRKERPYLIDDLPLALHAYSLLHPPTQDWRIHFHVPLFLTRLGALETTSLETIECLKSFGQDRRDSTGELPHFEVETYAWNVLPADWNSSTLAEGIAAEMKWARQHLFG